MQLKLLDASRPSQEFPPLSQALNEPNGLLAIGGCLSPERLINAYRHGIFPWYNPGEPILWWSPDPRLIIYPDQVIISRSLAKTLRKSKFTVTYDRVFDDVIEKCAKTRTNSTGTWITQDIKRAYNLLHKMGVAHSAEAWYGDELVGGLYGIAIGRVFFGESMFHTYSNASKVAFVSLLNQLKQWNYHIVDCQVRTEHLISLGAEEIARSSFVKILQSYCFRKPDQTAWQT